MAAATGCRWIWYRSAASISSVTYCSLLQNICILSLLMLQGPASIFGRWQQARQGCCCCCGDSLFPPAFLPPYGEAECTYDCLPLCLKWPHNVDFLVKDSTHFVAIWCNMIGICLAVVKNTKQKNTHTLNHGLVLREGNDVSDHYTLVCLVYFAPNFLKQQWKHGGRKNKLLQQRNKNKV